MSSRFFPLPAQCLEIWVVYANCHRGNMFERCELDKRNRSRFYSIWETESSRPCDVPPCDIQRTVLWKNLSHVEMRLERVKNRKPTAIDTRRCHRKHYQMTNEFALKVNKITEVNKKSKFTLFTFFFKAHCWSYCAWFFSACFFFFFKKKACLSIKMQ